MGENEKIGVDAFVGTDDFETGMNQYLKGLMNMEKGTKSAATQMTAGLQKAMASMGMGPGGIGGAAGASAGGLGTLASAGSAVTSGMGVLAGVAGGLVVTLGTALLGAVKKLATGYLELVQSGFMLAARVEQQDYMLQALGARFGLTTQQVRDQVDAIVDYGIRTDVAQDTLAQFIRYELDFAKAAQLARTAQDAATLANTDSSTELQRLIYGIQTQQTEVLRTAGIQINMNEAMKEYAAANHLSVESMTAAQRANAALDAVLKEGARNAGLYEASMNSVGKQLGSLSGREWPEFTRALSQVFLPAALTVVKTIREILKAWTEALSPGGRLYTLMVMLGAVCSIVADGFRVVATAISNWLLDVTGKFNTTFPGLIEQMFEWGIDTATQFAQGLIDGAANAITAAIQYISNMLTSWFAPGSPPRVAPQIDQWGMSTIAEWLRGFTEGDFSVLKTIQQPLKNALDTLAQMGTISKGAASGMFANLSKMLIEAMSGDAMPGEDMFDAIAESTGMFGDEVADLARKEVELASAMGDVKKAEDAVIAARKAEFAANTKVDKSIKLYNDMLRKGASKAELRAQQDRINANAEAARQATDQRVQAEDALVAQQQQIDLLEKAVALQQQLVDQMLQLAKAKTEELTPETKPAGGGGGTTAPTTGGGGGVLPTDFQIDMGPVSKAVEEMKEKIYWKIQMLVLRIKIAWIQLKQDAIQKWNEIKEAASGLWEQIVSGVGNFLARIVLGWIFKWNEIKETGKRLWGELRDALVELLSGMAVWCIEKWKEIKDKAEEKWEDLKETVKQKIEDMKTSIQTKIDLLKYELESKWESIKEKVKQKVEKFKEDVKTKFEEMKEGIKEKVQTAIDEVIGFFTGLPDRVSEFVQSLKDFGENIIQGIIDGFAKLDLVNELVNIVKHALEVIADLLHMDSPSKVMEGMGEDMIQGFINGIRNKAKTPVKLTGEMAMGIHNVTMDAMRRTQQMNRMASVPVPAAAGINRTVTNNLNISYGPVSVSGGFTWEQMKSGLRQVVREEFGR